MKQFFYYVVVAIAAFAVAFFVFNGYNKKSSSLPKVEKTNNDLQIVKTQLQQQSNNITQLMNLINEQNQKEIAQDKYSKLLLSLVNLNKELTKSNANVKFDIKNIQSYAEHDVNIAKIIDPILDIEEVHGLRYFKENFNQFARIVISNQKYDSSSKILQFLHKNIYPHFAYLGDHSPSASSLNTARIYLKDDNLKKFAEEIKEIDTEEEFVKEYQEDFEDFMKVHNASNDIQTYIESLILNTK